ncbi:Type I restriction-modification system, specificity subunit S [uncultured Candidatus Thioglobus sp.]|nr:Type I restriction-modification system, specificity subunit S [uncultured Candidatus Thioglobus sp.]
MPARVNQHVSIIRLKQDTLSSEFLHYLLISKVNKDLLLGIGEQGATRQAITKVQIQNFVVSYPKNNKEQEHSVKSIRKLKKQTQSLESKYQKELESLEELKKSILQKAFAG